MLRTLPARWRPLAALLVLTLLSGCDPAPASPPTDTPVEELGPNASIIRNPVTGNQPVADTGSVAKMQFDEGTEFAFGEVRAGAVVRHDFPFTNEGKQPLLITNARSTCGCTVPSYPKEPIPPGETGVISIAFDTSNKTGNQRKPVSITANTLPAVTTLYVSGYVNDRK